MRNGSDDGSDPEGLRSIVRFAAEVAKGVLHAWESLHPADGRPRAAIEAALGFADGGEGGEALRRAARGAHAAAASALSAAARDAALAAMCAANVAFPHPRGRCHRVWHVLGAAAHTAAAAGGLDPADPQASVREAQRLAGLAPSALADVLHLHPHSPPARGRTAALLHHLDRAIRDAPRLKD